MSQFVKREQLEEIMLSFTIEVYNEEDIEFINKVYSDYMNKKYIFQLSKTEQYFKQFVVTYCQVNYQTIVDKINFTNQNNRDDFIRNFGEQPKPNNGVMLEIPGNENEPFLENNEHQNKQQNENSNRKMIYDIIGGGVVAASIIGVGIYLYKKYYS